MARLFTQASSHRLTNANAVVAAKPFTFAAWVRPADTTTSKTLLSLGNNAGGVRNICYLDVGGGPQVGAFQFIAGAFSGFTHPTSYVQDTWHHAAAVFTASGNSFVYLDGVEQAGAIDNTTPTGLNTTAIGAFIEPNGTFINYFGGRIAEAGIWAFALSAAEVQMLALKKYAPPKVRNPYLAAYWKLGGTAGPGETFEPDRRRHYPMTITGAGYAEHPPGIIRPDEFD